jgi:hypothetical protein
MKCRLFVLFTFLALPAVVAGPQTFVSNCDVQFRIGEGRDAEGLAIPRQRAEFILPCMTKSELVTIIENFGKGDPGRKGHALDALRHAKQIKVVLTPEVATQPKD